jgi:hypothetical protein
MNHVTSPTNLQQVYRSAKVYQSATSHCSLQQQHFRIFKEYAQCAPIRFAHDEFHILFLSSLEYLGDSRGDAQAFGKATIYEIFLLLL